MQNSLRCIFCFLVIYMHSPLCWCRRLPPETRLAPAAAGIDSDCRAEPQALSHRDGDVSEWGSWRRSCKTWTSTWMPWRSLVEQSCGAAAASRHVFGPGAAPLSHGQGFSWTREPENITFMSISAFGSTFQCQQFSESGCTPLCSLVCACFWTCSSQACYCSTDYRPTSSCCTCMAWPSWQHQHCWDCQLIQVVQVCSWIIVKVTVVTVTAGQAVADYL